MKVAIADAQQHIPEAVRASDQPSVDGLDRLARFSALGTGGLDRVGGWLAGRRRSRAGGRVGLLVRREPVE